MKFMAYFKTKNEIQKLPVVVKEEQGIVHIDPKTGVVYGIADSNGYAYVNLNIGRGKRAKKTFWCYLYDQSLDFCNFFTHQKITGMSVDAHWLNGFGVLLITGVFIKLL